MGATVDLCICNLILATIVYTAEEARNDDIKFLVRTRKACEDQQRRILSKICAELDVDDSGTLTHEELLKGYEASTQFNQVAQSMRLSADDVKAMLFIADRDGSGDVDYMEFIDVMVQMRGTDTKSILMVLRRDVYYIKERLRENAAAQSAEAQRRGARKAKVLRKKRGAAKTVGALKSKILFEDRRCSNTVEATTPTSHVSSAVEEKENLGASSDNAIAPPFVASISSDSSQKEDARAAFQQAEPIAAAHERIRAEFPHWAPMSCSMGTNAVNMPISRSPPSRNDEILIPPETKTAIFGSAVLTWREPFAHGFGETTNAIVASNKQK